MIIEDFKKVLTQEERDRVDEEVVAELLPDLQKRRKQDEN